MATTDSILHVSNWKNTAAFKALSENKAKEQEAAAKEKRIDKVWEFMEWQMNLIIDYKSGKITHAQGMRMMRDLYPEFTPDDKEGEDSFTDRDETYECNACGVKLSRNDGCWEWNKEDDTYECVSCVKKNPDSSDAESEEEDDEWMTVYNEVSEFKDVCGGDENLKFFHHMPYYQCWGGGPVGGFLEDEDSDEVHEVNRTWGEPYTIVKTYEDSKIELSRGDADTTETMLRIVSCKPVAITKDQIERFRKIQVCAA